jgi:hypothetical protein
VPSAVHSVTGSAVGAICTLYRVCLNVRAAEGERKRHPEGVDAAGEASSMNPGAGVIPVRLEDEGIAICRCLLRG